jgi:hypothetical protein
MNDLTPNQYVVLVFFGFCGLVGIGIIATVLYLWVKDCRRAAQRPARALRRRYG